MAVYPVYGEYRHIWLLSLSDVVKKLSPDAPTRIDGYAKEWTFSDWYDWLDEQHADVQFVDDKGTPYYLYDSVEQEFIEFELPDTDEG